MRHPLRSTDIRDIGFQNYALTEIVEALGEHADNESVRTLQRWLGDLDRYRTAIDEARIALAKIW